MNIESIYRKYFKDVYLYIKAISGSDDIAEEITQETFFKALKHINKFRGECDIRVWLCQIAKNTYYNTYKQKKKIVMEPMEETLVDETVSIEKNVIEKEKCRILKQLLDEMEEPYQSVFRLRVYSELAFKEIGNAFQKTENWARVTYHRARAKMMKEMETIYGKE